KDKGNINYAFNYLNTLELIEGAKNILNINYKHKGFQLVSNASFRTTKEINNPGFLRNQAVLTKRIGRVVLRVGEESELNKLFVNTSDTLQNSSFEFVILQAFIHNADTTKNKFMLSYKQRDDNFPLVKDFVPTTRAEDVEFSMSLLKMRNHKLRSTYTYRKLNILSNTLTSLKPEETVLSRIEYNGNFFKNLISTNTYYEIGSGLEVKKEFLFVEVQPGQGTHTFIGDLNNNGVKDLNEFEIAVFRDQANYIKIFTPTNQFVKTYTNQFNQSLFLQPEALWGDKKGVRKLISRFSNRANFRTSRKVSDRENYFNPFIANVDDSSLVTLNMGVLNTFYF